MPRAGAATGPARPTRTLACARRIPKRRRRSQERPDFRAGVWRCGDYLRNRHRRLRPPNGPVACRHAAPWVTRRVAWVWRAGATPRGARRSDAASRPIPRGRTSMWPPGGRAGSKPFHRLCGRVALRPAVTFRDHPSSRTISRLDGPDRDQELVIGFVVIELLFAEQPHSQPLPERHRREHVPVSCYLEVGPREGLLEETPRRQGAQGPAVALVEPLTTGLPDAGEGREQRSSRLQDAQERPDRRSCVVDKVERLRADDTIERIRRHIVSAGEVGDDRCPTIVLIHIKHVALGDALAAILSGETGVFDLQHPPSDVLSITGDKALDIVAIYWPPAVKPELAADRLQPPQVTETYVPRPPSRPTSTTPPGRTLGGSLQAPVLLCQPRDLLALLRQFVLQKAHLLVTAQESAKPPPRPFNVSFHCIMRFLGLGVRYWW